MYAIGGILGNLLVLYIFVYCITEKEMKCVSE